jgi:hypothetical protein
MAGPSSAPDSCQPTTRDPSRKTRSNTPGLATELHWANLTAPELRLLDWEAWGQGPWGYDQATLYAYSLLRPDAAARVRDAFPLLGTPQTYAAEAVVCAELLQTVTRGTNLDLAGPLQKWADQLRNR